MNNRTNEPLYSLLLDMCKTGEVPLVLEELLPPTLGMATIEAILCGGYSSPALLFFDTALLFCALNLKLFVCLLNVCVAKVWHKKRSAVANTVVDISSC